MPCGKSPTGISTSPLADKIRNFRNRVYHNEPIAWNLSYLKAMYEEIHSVLGWLNKDLPTFVKPIDRFQEMLATAQEELK